MKWSSMKSLGTIMILLFMFWNVGCFAAIRVDVTGVITETSSGTHDCNHYAIDKYDSVNHWKECSICSNEYTKAGNPNDVSPWLKSGYLEVKTNSSSQTILVLKDTFKAHQYTNEYWTLGDSCSSNNKLVHLCNCGYRYETNNTRPHKNLEKVSNWASYAHYDACLDCFDWVNYTECTNANGRINCSNLGTCDGCGHTYTDVAHRATKWNEEGDGYCEYCGMYVGNVRYQIQYLENQRVEIIVTFTMNGNTEPYAHYIWPNTEFLTLESSSYEYNENIFVLKAVVQFKKELAKKGELYSAEIYWNMPDGSKAILTLTHLALKIETLPPTLNVSTTSDSIHNGWATNHKIIVSGSENYCSAVNLKMKEKGTGKVVYTAEVPVTNGNYSYEFIPDIVAGIDGKEYEIIVGDLMENATSQTISITKSDRISPMAFKENQMDSTGFWSTSAEWTSAKDFIIRATDEGSNIANIKIQSTNAITDDYSIDSRDTAKNPAIHSKNYQFVGNVGNYVTLTVYIQDEAGNTTTEYLRIYHLDDVAPSITTVVNDFQVKASLSDNLSGINGYAITNSVTEPSESEWQSLEASLTASNQVLEETRTMNVGNWYYWVKDQAGNTAYSAFTIETKEISLGDIQVIEKIEYDGNEKTPTPVVLVDGVTLIRGVDYTVQYQKNKESGVATILVTGIGNYTGSIETEFLIYIEKTEIDVTGLVTESSATNHNCNDYAIDKYDENYHWKECSVCSNEYIKAGRPIDATTWTKNGYLEVKTNSSGEKRLVVKNTMQDHHYTNDYWLMLDSNGNPSCSFDNRHVYLCECGYHYETIEGRPEHKFAGYEINRQYHVITCSVCREGKDGTMR